MTLTTKEMWVEVLEEYSSAHFIESQDYRIYGIAVEQDNHKYTDNRYNLERYLRADMTLAIKRLLRAINMYEHKVISSKKILKLGTKLSSVLYDVHNDEFIDTFDSMIELKKTATVLASKTLKDLKMTYIYIIDWNIGPEKVECKVLRAKDFLDYCLYSSGIDVQGYGEEGNNL